MDPTPGAAPPADRPAAAAPPRRAPSPTRQFAVLSLVTIGGSTLVFGLALAYFVERAILDREWASTAAFVRTAARFHLRSTDFAAAAGPRGAQSEEAVDRFEEFSRQVRMLPEVLRLAAYDGRGASLGIETERPTSPGPPQAALREALAGMTRVRLDPRGLDGRERVDLYVPLVFPGEGRVAGVVELHVDPSRVLASVRQARLVLWTLALLSGAALYAVLYGIVWRASRALRAQQAALVRRAEELGRANAELRQVQEQLVIAERFAAFGEITVAVAHGLANPLAGIRASAQVALLDAREPALRDHLRHVIAESDRMTDRMRALLDFGRPIDQRRVLTALDVTVRHALEQVHARATAQSVRFEIGVPGDLPKVRLDPARFEEALLCLVGNALDAMPGGGALRVTAAPAPPDAGATGPRLELVVEDTGPGIPPAVLAHVFEPFFTTKPDGTGLGLAVARKLLESGGGRLRLTSDGRGTRAAISLPADEA